MDPATYSELADLYRQLVNMSLAVVPLAALAGGYFGFVIGKVVERRRIMKEMQTLEDEDE